MTDSRFTSTALGAIRSAQENAARLGHSYVGSEHLLLGLASLEYSPAAQALRRTLAERGALSGQGSGTLTLYASDRPEDFGALAGQFLRRPLEAPVQHVDIERY